MKTPTPIRIATRHSALALWQANAVKRKLEQLGHTCELVLIESSGDTDLTQPIYSMGISGVFTKQLDIALLNNQADIAVHSLKDVPTQLAENLLLAAVLARGAHEDVALVKQPELLETKAMTVATSSLRRQAQWLAKYPHHKVVPIRGNVQTRLRKFEEDSTMDAVIFAKAGLERLNLLPADAITLDWMLPAPAQGTIGIVCRNEDTELADTCRKINHKNSFIAAHIERQFLRTLMGGCSVPISALAEINQDDIGFEGVIHSFDGSQCFTVYRLIELQEWGKCGKESAEKLLEQEGAAELIETIRNKTWN